MKRKRLPLWMAYIITIFCVSLAICVMAFALAQQQEEKVMEEPVKTIRPVHTSLENKEHVVYKQRKDIIAL